MKKLMSLLLAAALLLALAACGPSEKPSAPSNSNEAGGALPDEIIIGGLAPLKGNVAQYGIASDNGSKLAVDEINKAGGILGKQIKYISYDERGDATEATIAYDRLVNEDGIVALIGDITTVPTIAVAQKAVEDGIPMITPTGTGAAITQVGPNIFRACFTDPYQGELMAHYAKEKLGASSVAVLFDTGDDYSKGVADAFWASSTALGLTLTDKEGYQPGATDFNAQLTKIKAGNPDVVMVPGYYGDGAMILTQARALGITAKFLGSDGWDGLLNQVDPSNYGVLNDAFYCTQYALREPGEELQRVMDAYTEFYANSDPKGEYLNMFAILGYEAMHIMAAAIEKAGSTDSGAIVEALKNLDYDGVSGNIAYKGGQDPAREAYIVEFVDGQEVMRGVYSF
ncbi:MAG: ABC transporter substrate-binding protein [Fastidiosipila sp.]|jgi:branched-chain amino acid transport system substrate-binding protein|nr:ABC transporter substrate-binding protein [Fastidiosipila sp.]